MIAVGQSEVMYRYAWNTFSQAGFGDHMPGGRFHGLFSGEQYDPLLPRKPVSRQR